MTNPITHYTKSRGPLISYGQTTGWGGNGSWVSYLKQVSGFRQKKPYNINTTYLMDEYKTLNGPIGCNSWNWSPGRGEDYDVANNNARRRFINQLGDSSSFGATATAEGQKTLSMVVTVVTRLALAARYVRRMELFKAAETLGLPYKEKDVRIVRYRNEYISRKNGLGRTRVRTRVIMHQTKVDWGTGRLYAKNAASGWLLWSYGASPLISDIHNAVDIFTKRPPLSKQVIGRGTANSKSFYESYGTRRSFESVTRVKFQAYVTVSNPNLWLANQLGLINPLQWINEAIPLSFTVDWFSNLSDVISQFTDFHGLSLESPQRLIKQTLIEGFYPSDGYQLPAEKQWTRFTRDPMIPPVNLVFALERVQWQRGLNAISLLVGILPRK